MDYKGCLEEDILSLGFVFKTTGFWKSTKIYSKDLYEIWVNENNQISIFLGSQYSNCPQSCRFIGHVVNIDELKVVLRQIGYGE